MMIRNNSTTYSVVGSLGIHVLFTLGAGSFLMNINDVQRQKTYKLEFVKRKTPPPIKKEMIQKEPVFREIKVAKLTPKTLPVLQPKKAIQQTKRARNVVNTPIATSQQVQKVTMEKQVIMRNSPTVNRKINTPVVRSFLPDTVSLSSKRSTRVAMIQGTAQLKLNKLPKRVVSSSSSVTSSKRSTRVAMFQGTPQFKLHRLPKEVVRSGSSSSKTDNSKVKMVQTGVRLASFSSLPSPRNVPNIGDTGALKSYIGRVQNQIASAKRYPESSRRAGRQGILKVQFIILKNGEVDNVKLLTETPYPNLNREAMAAVKRAAPFAGIPDVIMKESLNVILPFRFELN